MISRRDRDLLTPYRLTVLILIDKYGRCHDGPWAATHDLPPATYNLYGLDFDAETRKYSFTLIANLVQGNDMPLSDLMKIIHNSGIPPQFIEVFIQGLREMASEGVEAFICLFDSMDKLIEQDSANANAAPCFWTSLAGLHIRQSSLAFRRIGFHFVVSLYEKFQQYYEKCQKDFPDLFKISYEIKQPKAGSNYSASINETTEGVNESELSMSDTIESVHATEEKQVIVKISPNVIPDFQLSHDNITTRQQAEAFIQEQLSLIIRQEAETLPPPKLQNILNSLLKNCPDLGKGHFLSYLNCLRMKEFTGAVHSLVRAYDSKIIQKDPSRGEDITKTFRYAALNMAGLQASFGHNESSLLALEEAIRLSQESNDHMCLQYTLAWLYTMTASDKTQMIKLSYDRSKDMDMPYMAWLGLLNHTIELSKKKTSPGDLLTNLFGKMTLSHNQEEHSLDGGVVGQAGVWGVQAALWAMWGNVSVTSMCSQQILHLQSQTNFNLNTPSCVSPACVSVCNMALHLADMGEYTQASLILKHSQNQFPSPWEQSKHWLFAQAYIGFYESLHQCLWPQALNMINSMATTRPSQAKLMKAELLVEKCEYGLALRLCAVLRKEKLSCDLKTRAIIIEAQAQAGGNNLGAALSTLAEAISLANEYHLAYLEAIARMQLASVQMHLGQVKEAQMNLEKGLLVILSGGGISDHAKAMLLSSKLQARRAEGPERQEQLLKAAGKLGKVRKLFEKLRAFGRVKEALYLQARFFNEAGDIESRNKAAFQFRKFEENHPNVQPNKNTIKV